VPGGIVSQRAVLKYRATGRSLLKLLTVVSNAVRGLPAVCEFPGFVLAPSGHPDEFRAGGHRMNDEPRTLRLRLPTEVKQFGWLWHSMERG